jgi:hypothetical protein
MSTKHKPDHAVSAMAKQLWLTSSHSQHRRILSDFLGKFFSHSFQSSAAAVGGNGKVGVMSEVMHDTLLHLFRMSAAGCHACTPRKRVFRGSHEFTRPSEN